MQNEVEIDWSRWESLGADRAKRLAVQLKMEVGRLHRLFDVIDGLEVLAADRGSDDILVAEPSDPVSAFIVHLTWSNTPDTDSRFPWTATISKESIPTSFT